MLCLGWLASGSSGARSLRSVLVITALGSATLAAAQTPRRAPYWATHAGSEHWAQSPAPVQPLQRVLWSMPVDLAPQYSFGTLLLIHYGSPLITGTNVILVPVKTGATDGFRVEARNGTTGALLHTISTDYSIATGTSWVPSFSPTLDMRGGLHVPALGGTVLYMARPEVGGSAVRRRCFYGISEYLANKAIYDTAIKIHTPISADRRGNIWFGYRVYGPNPKNIESGIAMIRERGQGMYRSAAQITGDPDAVRVQTQCAPAFSRDQRIVYFAIQRGSGGGYLVGLDATTMATVYKTRLYDPYDGTDALISGQSTSSPMIAPDGDVYYGVLVNSQALHNSRGYLLHFDRTLAFKKTPGSFGWDHTPSLVPPSAVPNYSGGSPYLLLMKYNNYAGAGTGDGVNKVAILDPFYQQFDFISGIPVMKEVYTQVGPTPDPNHVGPTYPNAVWEWCINSGAVDSATDSAIVNSEDGYLYRWNLATNQLTESVLLDGPRGQAYTMTITGPTGIAYAINNARLFAVGRNTP